MNTQHIETLIIGAGQAGLSTGYHLRRRGRPLLIADANARIGDNWRQQWDTLRPYTPAQYDKLPGLPFPAARWHCPQKDEVGDYLERYALHFDLPVRTSTGVERLEPRPEGGYLATVGDETISCDNVVVATGTFGRTPNVPAFAAELNSSIQQLHSSHYRRPGQLRPGPALVVGASHSGLDIAYELAESRETILCGPSRGNIPFRPESRRARVLMPAAVFAFRHVLTRRTPLGRREMNEVRFHGGPAFRIKQNDLDRRGVVRNHSRVTGVIDGRPQLGDGTILQISSVVWCTGFSQVFDWIGLPILDQHGWPVEYRAVWERLGGRYEIARCRVQFGRALHALGDEESAITELAAAQHSFAELGTAPAEREAAALITLTYPSGLTAREVEVLCLVAAGKSNHEIAAQLILSEKTVARHPSNIFTKLDVTSPTAAAAFAYEHHIT
jgi:putative flavoprotein involved in K+ transport